MRKPKSQQLTAALSWLVILCENRRNVSHNYLLLLAALMRKTGSCKYAHMQRNQVTLESAHLTSVCAYFNVRVTATFLLEDICF